MREPWKQLPQEDSRQFASFAAYRDMDPNVRSIRRACEEFHGDQFTENDYRRWTTYSAKYRWKQRARAWDEYKDDVSRETELAAMREMKREQVQRARRLQSVADKSLERELRKFEDDPDYQINPALILQFATQGAAMERTVRGEPATVTTGEEGEQTLKIEWGAPNDGKQGVEDPAASPASGAAGDSSESS